MKNQKDERIVNLENRINSNAFTIAVFLFVVSIVIKGVFYTGEIVWADSMVYLDGLAFLIPAVYVFVCNIRLGNNNFPRAKVSLLVALATAAAGAGLVWVRSSHPDQGVILRNAALCFAVIFFGLGLVYLLLGRLSRYEAGRREARMLWDLDGE